MAILQDHFLGRTDLPVDMTDHDIATYFTFSDAELSSLEATFRTKTRFVPALMLGHLRLTGCRLDSVQAFPKGLAKFIARQLKLERVPEIASIRSLSSSKTTAAKQFKWAMDSLKWKIPNPRIDDRNLEQYLIGVAATVSEKKELLNLALRWKYDQKLLIPAARGLEERCNRVFNSTVTGLHDEILRVVPEETRVQWFNQLLTIRTGRVTYLEWLQAPLRKRSPTTLETQFEKVEFLKSLGVHKCDLRMIPYDRQLAYYRELQNRAPSKVAATPVSDIAIELVCFLSVCLRKGTDTALNLVTWSTTDLMRQSRRSVREDRAKKLEVVGSAADQVLELTREPYESDKEAENKRIQIQEILSPLEPYLGRTKAQLEREEMIQRYETARKLAGHVVDLGLSSEKGTLAEDALNFLKSAGERETKELGSKEKVRVRDSWDPLVNGGDDSGQRFKAATLASLVEFCRGVRKGDLWIPHSESYRERKDLLISDAAWASQRKRYLIACKLPSTPKELLRRIWKTLEDRLVLMAEGLKGGDFKVNADNLSIGPIDREEDPDGMAEYERLLDEKIGYVHLPELLLKVDARTHFSRPLLGGRLAYDANELLSTYGALLANGSDLTAKNISLMTPGIKADQIASRMKALQDPAMLRSANDLVLEYMLSFPIVDNWRLKGWISGDAVSLETTKHLYSARLEPRKRTPSTAIYLHVLDRYGMPYDQPMIINRRQDGYGLEGALRQRNAEIEKLAVDTHGSTHFGMTIAKLNCFDVCPRLKNLRERRLIVPHGMKVPKELLPVTQFISMKAFLDPANYDALLHIAASIADGTVSAPVALRRFGYASKGDPVYEAGEQYGKVLRTLFLCDYYTNPNFRRELHRVLNRGEAVHTLNRAIYSGRMPHFRGRTDDELGAVTGSLRLLSNIALCWSVEAMQLAHDELGEENRKPTPEMMAKIGPIRFGAINFRGILDFPLAAYAKFVIGAPVRDRSGKDRFEVRPLR